MQTRKLYYEDCHLAEFSAVVVSCEQTEEGWLVELDQTAFYPEGGGQAADTGTLGGVKVLHTREDGETVLHRCDGALAVGQTVTGKIDWALRFARMQQHTGEHIVSGLIFEKYGYHNVGFHMGADCITIDFDGIIPAEELPGLERRVNEAIWQDIPLNIWTPTRSELPDVFYRTKRALPWPVRIVEVPGYDSCACCGVHVERTGEIGLVKLLNVVRFRSGTRMELLCGSQALDYLNRSHEQNKLVSQAFSAQLFETGEAARKMNEQLGALKFRIGQLENRMLEMTAAACGEKGNVLLLRPGLDSVAVRKLADRTADCCGGIAAVFSGSDENGYSYCLVARNQDLRPFGKAVNAALNGRGGGKPECIQGSVKASRELIIMHFDGFCIL